LGTLGVPNLVRASGMACSALTFAVAVQVVLAAFFSQVEDYDECTLARLQDSEISPNGEP